MRLEGVKVGVKKVQLTRFCRVSLLTPHIENFTSKPCMTLCDASFSPYTKVWQTTQGRRPVEPVDESGHK